MDGWSDNVDTCLVCGKEIPPGPDCCSPECDTKYAVYRAAITLFTKTGKEEQ